MKKKVISFLRKNIMMEVAIFFAAITCFFVPINAEYLKYFDVKTLTCLFCILAVVGAFQNIKFFDFVAQKILTMFKNMRALIMALILITFVSSMLIANDMALITFLPLGFLVLKSADRMEYMAFTFIMQNISANLGGMLTPFGNPQNLYLYNYFNISNLEFVQIMAIPFAVSIALLTACCFIFVRKQPIKHLETDKIVLKPARTIIYSLLFALSIVVVFRVVEYYIALIVIPLALVILDRKALRKVDYPLLITFVAFFIFSGNLSRLDLVSNLIKPLLELNTLLFGTLSCQVISNVPSAILLSKFTTNYPALLIAVNIGGVGTIISSLASLITFREYTKYNPKRARSYLGLFSLFNFAFLVILIAVSLFLV